MGTNLKHMGLENGANMGKNVTHESFLDRRVTQILTQQRVADKEAHIPSGKLSASSLGNPVQWQVLKAIGVPSRDADPYTLRKFLRGNHVEEWLVGCMDVVETQKPVEYRGVVGLVDAVVDMQGWDSGPGIVPHEIKSVTNAKFTRIVGNMRRRSEGADPQHRLQTTLYALAMGTDKYVIHYVASDDYRIKSLPYRTEETADEVDRIIDLYEGARRARMVPTFTPRYSWQASSIYSNYPEWASLSPKEIEEKLLKEYPESYEKLMKGGEL